MKELPQTHRILPYSVPFKVPGFMNTYYQGLVTLAPDNIDTEKWFKSFCDDVISRIGKEYYPVCRLSDGEFKLFLGEQPLDELWPLHTRIRSCLSRILRRCFSRKVFQAGGSLPNGERLYHSGTYTPDEIHEIRKYYTHHLCTILETGTLAIHLTHGTILPFQQHFFPALGKWILENRISLNTHNYVPFYFVYALLIGDRKHEVICGKRVLIIHSADGRKRKNIERHLLNAGATAVEWIKISTDRSWYDKIDVSQLIGKVDICLIGAGVGKVKILPQLRFLKIPCVDIGYVFEAWANPEVARHRAFMLPDSDPSSKDRPYIICEERVCEKP